MQSLVEKKEGGFRADRRNRVDKTRKFRFTEEIRRKFLKNAGFEELHAGGN